MPKAKEDEPDAMRKERIQKVLDDWIPRLSLTAWDITWELVDELKDDQNASARITPMFPYQRAHIRFVRKAIDSAGIDAELEIFVIHELNHLLIAPLWETIDFYLGESKVANELHANIETLMDVMAMTFQTCWNQKWRGALYSPVKE